MMAAQDFKEATVPGEVTGNYKLEHRIGKGTYGNVFLAKNLTTGEQVAIKKIIFHVLAASRRTRMKATPPPDCGKCAF